MAKRAVVYEVIGGNNLLPQSFGNIYTMADERKKCGPGVVSVKKKLYYLLGVHKEEKYSRNVGTTAAGAIVGGVLTGGVGAVVGAAIGARRKDDSIHYIDLVDYETKQEFTVQVKLHKSSRMTINELPIVNPSEIGLK